MSVASLHLAQVLCPTDFSVFSSRAFRHALALAHRFRARLRVVHVLPVLPDLAGSGFLATPILPSPDQRRQAEADMRQFVEAAAGSGVEVTTEIRDGQPWREILTMARDLPADLVTLGTHGRSGFERFVLGSMTDKLLGRLPCPALSVCHEEGRTWEAPGLVNRVLCATDFSAPATEGVALALGVAHKIGSEVTLLHVIDALPDAEEYVYYSVPEIVPLRKALEEQALSRLQAAVPKDLPSGLKVEIRLVTGRAHEQILATAAELRADLIVLGTRGHGPLGRLLFGSTSERIVREASCPVVTVPPLGAARLLAHEAATSAVEVALAR
jgi:nucleotide-binding universal stress UspA family protein